MFVTFRSAANVRYISVAFVVLVPKNGIGRLSYALAFEARNEVLVGFGEGRFFGRKQPSCDPLTIC